MTVTIPSLNLMTRHGGERSSAPGRREEDQPPPPWKSFPYWTVLLLIAGGLVTVTYTSQAGDIKELKGVTSAMRVEQATRSQEVRQVISDVAEIKNLMKQKSELEQENNVLLRRMAEQQQKRGR